MERVHPGEVALVLEEGLDRVDLEWEEGVALEQVQAQQGNVYVLNAAPSSLMKSGFPAPIRTVQNVEQKW
jgi:hypothetical protein